MSTVPGTSCLLTDLDDLTICTRPGRAADRPPRPPMGPVDPGDDRARAALRETVGRRATLCGVCGVPVSELGTRRSKSGKTFCHVCADRAVAAYIARHPAARPPRLAGLAKERTGTAYLAERERYAVRYHGGNGRWQISDTQARRWTSQSHATEADATAAADTMNAAWRAQITHERETLSFPIVPSTSPRHTWRVGDRGYGREGV